MKKHLLLIVSGIAVSLILSSCNIADPEYLEGMKQITNTNYPASKIYGHWMRYDQTPLNYAIDREETKFFYLFNPDGSGTQRIHTKDGRGIEYMSETPMRWQYQGGNKWRVGVADASQTRIIESSPGLRVNIEPWPAQFFTVRYGNGRLYHMGMRRIMVRASDAPSYVRLQRQRQQQSAQRLMITR